MKKLTKISKAAVVCPFPSRAPFLMVGLLGLVGLNLVSRQLSWTSEKPNPQNAIVQVQPHNATVQVQIQYENASTTPTIAPTTPATPNPTPVPVPVPFCSRPEGSLHQLAMDMVHHSSPPGSPSYRKLQHVLDSNPSFFIDLGPIIFDSIRESIASMLIGYGLQRIGTASNGITNVTIVETQWTQSPCPLAQPHCQNHSRITIQSEQKFGDHLGLCHASPNCIIFDFSDHNYRLLGNRGLNNSIVLLPVMTQQPSRLNPPPASSLKPLADRSLDVVFFGVITERRKFLPHQVKNYFFSRPNPKTNKRRNTRVMYLDTIEKNKMSADYKEAKVCLVTHSYFDLSGGEYHRLSEFASFGCIPVMEVFADRIGIDRYEQCGKVVFAPLPDSQLLKAADTVLQKIDDRNSSVYKDFSHVEWWNAGIRWAEILTTVFSKVPVVSTSATQPASGLLTTEAGAAHQA